MDRIVDLSTVLFFAAESQLARAGYSNRALSRKT